MKGIWTIIALLFAFAANAQQTQITNTFDDAHFALPGTHTSVIPPSGFGYDDAISGFANNTGASVVVNKLTGNYQQNESSFSQPSLQAEGYTNITITQYKINGFDAIHVEATNGTTTINQLLIGDGTTAVLVKGVSIAGDAAMKAEIKASVLSVIYEAGS